MGYELKTKGSISSQIYGYALVNEGQEAPCLIAGQVR